MSSYNSQNKKHKFSLQMKKHKLEISSFTLFRCSDLVNQEKFFSNLGFGSFSSLSGVRTKQILLSKETVNDLSLSNFQILLE